MREIIRAERDRGATVFFSSHVLEQVEAVCDRVAILRNGRIVAVDTIDALRGALGTDARLTLTVDGITDELVETVAGVHGVASVRADGDRTLSVACDDDAKTAVLGAVDVAGGTLIDFDTEQVSLEELFAAYTEDAKEDATSDDGVMTPGSEAPEVRA
jgi:ABC-2 type transport system ATP-binding protein